MYIHNTYNIYLMAYVWCFTIFHTHWIWQIHWSCFENIFTQIVVDAISPLFPLQLFEVHGGGKGCLWEMEQNNAFKRRSFHTDTHTNTQLEGQQLPFHAIYVRGSRINVLLRTSFHWNNFCICLSHHIHHCYSNSFLLDHVLHITASCLVFV